MKLLRSLAVRDRKVPAKTAAIQLVINIVVRCGMTATFALCLGSVFYVVKPFETAKPENIPTYESALPESRKICRQPVVTSEPKLYATHVVVVRQNGDTVRMDTGEAWARAKSEERSDDVWVVGICAEDLVDPSTYRKPANDNVVDVTFE